MVRFRRELAQKHQSSDRGNRGRRAKRTLEADGHTFAEFRQEWAPLDPSVINEKFRAKSASPASKKGTEVFGFTSPVESTNVTTLRWQFWLAVARCGYLPRELYVGSKYEAAVAAHHKQNGACNANPGTQGQCILHTPDGTILWMIGTKRLYSQNPSGQLLKRLAVWFEPWKAPEEGGAFLEDRWPAAQAHCSKLPGLDFNLSAD